MWTQDSGPSAGEETLRRGVAAARAGLLGVASASFERALEQLPDDPTVWLWLSWVANSPDNTIRCLERVLELSPGHPAASAGLIWVRALTNDTPSTLTVDPAPPVIEALEEPVAPVGVEVEVATPVEVQTEAASESVLVESVKPHSDWGSAPVSVPVAASVSEVVAESSPEAVDDWRAPPTPMVPLRRRWNELVERGPESPDEANTIASSSVTLLPLPNEPPPLPTFSGALDVPVQTRFNGISTGPEPEAGGDVDVLATSFHPPSEVASSDGRPLVMVVDDSPTVRKLVALTLERRGYRVISAFDGVAAIKELGTCRPDLILLDINMPRLDGYRLCKLIKKHEATQGIPVVMLSGKDGMFDKLRGRLVGCSDYITKPFEADALTHKVAKYLTAATISS